MPSTVVEKALEPPLDNLFGVNLRKPITFRYQILLS